MKTTEDLRDMMQSMIEIIVAEYAPHKVILFGSHARGKPREDSDVDLLIIKETTDRFIDRFAEVQQMLTGTHRRIPVQTLILTPSEIEARLTVGDQFIAEILESGEVLYAA